MELFDAISAKFNYWVYIVIMMIGDYAMISKNNFIKKLIGMSIFQTAIILFYVSIGVKEDATIPILYHEQVHPSHDAGHHSSETGHGDDAHGSHEDSHAAIVADLHIEADDFGNPLPHVLMLTAIVVGVATLGLGLALTQKIYRDFGSIEESEILESIKSAK